MDPTSSTTHRALSSAAAHAAALSAPVGATPSSIAQTVTRVGAPALAGTQEGDRKSRTPDRPPFRATAATPSAATPVQRAAVVPAARNTTAATAEADKKVLVDGFVIDALRSELTENISVHGILDLLRPNFSDGKIWRTREMLYAIEELMKKSSGKLKRTLEELSESSRKALAACTGAKPQPENAAVSTTATTPPAQHEADLKAAAEVDGDTILSLMQKIQTCQNETAIEETLNRLIWNVERCRNAISQLIELLPNQKAQLESVRAKISASAALAPTNSAARNEAADPAMDRRRGFKAFVTSLGISEKTFNEIMNAMQASAPKPMIEILEPTLNSYLTSSDQKHKIIRYIIKINVSLMESGEVPERNTANITNDIALLESLLKKYPADTAPKEQTTASLVEDSSKVDAESQAEIVGAVIDVIKSDLQIKRTSNLNNKLTVNEILDILKVYFFDETKKSWDVAACQCAIKMMATPEIDPNLRTILNGASLKLTRFPNDPYNTQPPAHDPGHLPLGNAPLPPLKGGAEIVTMDKPTHHVSPEQFTKAVRLDLVAFVAFLKQLKELDDTPENVAVFIALLETTYTIAAERLVVLVYLCAQEYILDSFDDPKIKELHNKYRNADKGVPDSDTNLLARKFYKDPNSVLPGFSVTNQPPIGPKGPVDFQIPEYGDARPDHGVSLKKMIDVAKAFATSSGIRYEILQDLLNAQSKDELKFLIGAFGLSSFQITELERFLQQNYPKKNDHEPIKK